MVINSLLMSCVYNENKKTYTFNEYYYNCINAKLNNRLELKKDFYTLNKGIDELIEKLSIQLNCYYKNPQELGDKIIKDLKKLKGE